MEVFTNDLLAARGAMAFSLAFHIIFASVGMVMPFFMAASHYFYLKTNDENDLHLTRMWSKGVAILFAIGAVSGTVLSFELGLLWPRFMDHAGPIIGMPFSWEGTAFFLEAIAIGIFLYGWNKIPKWSHWFSGLMVGISGLASGIFIISANSWMNTPAGFDWVEGRAIHIDPVAAMFNRHWTEQSLHMCLAAFSAVGFAVAGIHAFYLRKNNFNKRLNFRALKIALTFGAIASVLQPLSGHYSAQLVAKNQPAKLAAMESLYKTQDHAPLKVGPLEIPGALSLLAFNDVRAKVTGLDQFPKENWPPVALVHNAFQLMVFLGSLLAALSLIFLYMSYVKKVKEYPRWLIGLFTAATPLGFLALEAGWVVTEVGRQPWVIYGILKTKDSLTIIPGLGFHFLLFIFLYLIIGSACAFLLYRLIKNYQENHEGEDHAD